MESVLVMKRIGKNGVGGRMVLWTKGLKHSIKMEIIRSKVMNVK
jgi:hypothetical protein